MASPRYVSLANVKALLGDTILSDDDPLINDIIASIELSVDRGSGYEFSRRDGTATGREFEVTRPGSWARIPHIQARTSGENIGTPDVSSVQRYTGDEWGDALDEVDFRYTENGLACEWVAEDDLKYSPRGLYLITAKWGWAQPELPTDLVLGVTIQAAYQFQRVQATASRGGVVGVVGGQEFGGLAWHTDAYNYIRRFRSSDKFGVVVAC